MSLAYSSGTDVAEAAVFGPVMGLVATALGVFTLGAHLGRHLSGGASLVCFIVGFVCFFALKLRPWRRGRGDRPPVGDGILAGARPGRRPGRVRLGRPWGVC
jgi:hypothetical protein